MAVNTDETIRVVEMKDFIHVSPRYRMSLEPTNNGGILIAAETLGLYKVVGENLIKSRDFSLDMPDAKVEAYHPKFSSSGKHFCIYVVITPYNPDKYTGYEQTWIFETSSGRRVAAIDAYMPPEDPFLGDSKVPGFAFSSGQSNSSGNMSCAPSVWSLPASAD